MKKRLLKHPYPAILGIFTLATGIFSAFYTPKIATDDWALIISGSVFKNLTWVDWSRTRPFDLTLFRLCDEIFGLNISAYYAINFLFLVSISIIIYQILARLFSTWRIFAFCVAILILIYPIDFTRTWLIMAYIHAAWLISLIGLWFLIDFAEKGKAVHLFLAFGCIGLPLGAYEGPIGVVGLTCLLIAVLYPNISRNRRLWTLSILLLLGLYALWRIVFQPKMNIYDGYNTSFYRTTFDMLVTRFKMIPAIVFGGWVEIVGQILNGTRFGSIDPFQMAPILLASIVASGGIAFLVCRIWPDFFLKQDILPDERRYIVKRLVVALFLGAGFVIAGYIPVITIMDPNLINVSSRINQFAIPGASVVIVSMIVLAVLAVARFRRQAHIMILAMIIPLILIGAFVQVSIQYQDRKTWKKQTQMWSSLFQAVPNFKNDTTVLFIFPGYRQMSFSENPPLVADWEANYGLRVLYNNETLTGHIYFPDIDLYSEAQLTPDSLIGPRSKSSYEKLVIVVYDLKSRQMKVVKDMQQELGLSFTNTAYRPDLRIINDIPPDVRYRFLVGSASKNSQP